MEASRTRPMRMALVVVSLIVGCSPPPGATAPAPTSSPPVITSSSADAPAPQAGAVGDACKPDRENPQSTCGDGLRCIPTPGGYCSRTCGATGSSCPAGSACMPTAMAGEACARTCARDADCRAEQGYVCDPGRKVCFLPFMASPVLPKCPAASPPDGGFSAPNILSTAASAGIYQFEPAAALLPNGDLVVVYTSGGPMFGPSFLGVARVPRGGAPVIDRPLSTSKKNHFDAWAAATRDGAVHAVWLGHDGGGVDRNAEIGYARSTDGGVTWTPPVAVHAPADCPPNTPFCLDKPMIASGPLPGRPDVEALRVFYRSETAEGMRMRTSLDGGKTWDAPVSVVEHAYGDVAIDGKGHVHVAVSAAKSRGAAAWGSADNAVAYTVSIDGKTFAKPIIVSAPGESTPFYFVNPTLAVDDRGGWVYVAYAAGSPDGRWDIQLAATHDGGKTWKRTKVNDDASCNSHMAPNLALDPADGSVHVTFLENRGGGGHLAYTRCKPAGGPCAPVVRASPDMAAYELVRHSSKWLGEYGALAVDPKHRVLHAVWGHTVQEGEHAIARLRHATRKLDAPGR